jgi:hypothetical protein
MRSGYVPGCRLGRQRVERGDSDLKRSEACLQSAGYAGKIRESCLLPIVFAAARELPTVRSDDCAEGDSHALTCSPDSNRDRLPCGQGMRECRSPLGSRMFESDGFDRTTEKCVALFQPIQRAVQLRDNCLALISDDDEFDIDLFV